MYNYHKCKCNKKKIQPFYGRYWIRWPPSVGSKCPLRAVTNLCWVDKQDSKKGQHYPKKITTQKELSPPKEDSHQPQRKVTDFSTSIKILIFICIGCACLIHIFISKKSSKNWVNVSFIFFMNRDIEKCAKLLF